MNPRDVEKLIEGNPTIEGVPVKPKRTNVGKAKDSPANMSKIDGNTVDTSKTETHPASASTDTNRKRSGEEDGFP